MENFAENAKELDLKGSFIHANETTYTWIPSGLGLNTSGALTLYLKDRMTEFPEPQLTAANILAWEMSLKEENSNPSHPDQYVEKLRKPLNLERNAPEERKPAHELTKQEIQRLNPAEALISLAMSEIQRDGKLSTDTSEGLYRYVFGKSNAVDIFTYGLVLQKATPMASDYSLFDKISSLFKNEKPFTLG